MMPTALASSFALDLIFSDHFSRHEPGVFAPLREMLLSIGESTYRALCGSHIIAVSSNR
jgi:hypothetical protein